MRLERYTDPALFLRDADALLALSPAANSRITLRIAHMLEATAQEDFRSYQALVNHRTQVIAAAFAARESEEALLAGTREDAMAVIARDAYDWCPALRGVVGPVAMAEAFAREWFALTRRAHRIHVHLGEYVLTEATFVPKPSSRYVVRVAYANESLLLQDWLEAFLLELSMVDDVGRARIRQARKVERGEVWVLADGTDAPLSMAGYSEVPPDSARIAPVYTPPELRHRGYASGVVTGLCRELFTGGKRAIYLAADLSNPISNALYQRIGFRAESDHYHLVFADSAVA